MNIINQSTSPFLPNDMWIQPPSILDFPFIVEVGDQRLTVGSGIGNGSGSARTALGEYFERNHFYFDILPECSSNLQESLSPTEVEKFVKAFSQTASTETDLRNLTHRQLNMSSVVRISDFSACTIPTICIALSHDCNEENDSIYPSRDTCGCSFHKNIEPAIFGAIKESLERQFLTRFWLTKQCNGVVPPSDILKAINASSAFGLYNTLSKSGEIVTFDISDTRFPGVCLLTIYGSNDPNRNVRYCAGMSYAESLATALDKSMLELWQTFRFMNLFNILERDPDSLHDSYIRYFMKCNHYNTFEEIASDFSYLQNPTYKQKTLEFNTNGLLQTLKTMNIEGYLHIKPTKINNSDHTFCKFISPSIFMHMDNSKNINLNNDYSESFFHLIDKNRQAKMVPFP
ncbi:YcaO-like family protein [Pseudomonas baetica]|uniref:YcaO-like family protein n=1 Tax=Pseudomonas baetica TaxID=674054 RepID=UPI003EED8575